MRFFSQDGCTDEGLNKVQALFIFNSPLYPMGPFSNLNISKCSRMPERYQLVPMSGHVRELEAVKNCNYARLAGVHLCQLDYKGISLFYTIDRNFPHPHPGPHTPTPHSHTPAHPPTHTHTLKQLLKHFRQTTFFSLFTL